jgi:phosphate:Na+ symporter
VAAGAFVTVLMQSSSATTVMLVSFVRAGLMSFAQSIGIILGADIGTTITAQLIAFKLTDYALLVIGIGFALSLLTKRDGPKNLGETILGFGLLFFGMDIMAMSMAPLQTHPGFIGLLVALENPLLGILAGAAFTALIQSSGAFAGILIVLGSQGLLSLEAAIPLLFGANIGTCVTAGLACIGTSRDAQRVALAHVLFKVAGVLLFVWWIPQFADLVRRLSPGGDPAFTGELLPRQIANAHTIFNVALTAVLLPFTHVAARLITRILPDRQHAEPPPYQTRHLDDALLGTPALALNLAKAEVVHMGAIVEAMVEKVIRPFTLRDRGVIAELERDEEAVDYLEDAIQLYLRAISRESVGRDRVTEVFQMMYTVTELEQIADIIDKSLLPRARDWLEHDLRFSPEGELELKDYHLRTVKQMSRAISVFENVNLEAASRMKKKHRKYRKMEEQYLRSHYDRILRDIPHTLKSSEYHQDLMEQFRRITSHSTRIARIFLDGEDELVKKETKEQGPSRL